MTVSSRQIVNGPVGVDVSKEWNDIDGSEFALGTKVEFSDGDVYRLVRAAAAKTIGLLYIIDENWLVGDAATSTNTDALPNAFGIPAATSTAPATLNASATYTYFWIQTAGNFDRVETSAASADNALAYTSGTGGKIDDGDGSGNIIQALKFTAAATGATNTTAFSPCELHIASA